MQADEFNDQVRHVIVAEISSNLAHAADPVNVFIDVTTPDGMATGLEQNSIVGCLFLSTIFEERIDVIGSMSESLMRQIDSRLRRALNLDRQ